MVGFLGRNDWSIRTQHKVDSWVRNQVGLELSHVDIEGSVESQRSGQGRDDLGNQSVKVSVGWSFNVQVSSADIIDGLVIQHDSDVGVFQQRVSRKNGVVWFNNCSGDLRGRIDSESQFGFLSVINRKSFQEQRSKT